MLLNVRPYNNHEMLLFPPCVGDYLEEHHPAWIIDEIVETLDLTHLYEKTSTVGNPAYHPKMMVKILFYAYANRTFSSRKIAKKTKTDVAFIFLSGMQKPDFRTISDFRKDNIEFLNHLFVQIVKICQRLGMIGLEHMSGDGTILKANASADKTYTLEKLTKEEEEIQKQIKELFFTANQIDCEEDEKFGPNNNGEEVPEDINTKQKRAKKLQNILAKLQSAQEELKSTKKEKINLTDNDAQFQGGKGKKIPGYRGEIIVDNKEQVIVACDVTNEQNDTNQAIPLTEQALHNLEIEKEHSEPENKIKISADSNFSSGDNLQYFENKDNIDAYIPDVEYQAQQRGKQCHKSQFAKEFFKYNPQENCFICPEGKKLPYVGQRKKRREHWVSLYQCHDCKKCRHFGICTKSPKGRHIYVSGYEQLISNMRQKLSTLEGKLIYAKRKIIVEPVLGNLKQNLQFREFLLRRFKKVKGEFSLIATAHNLLKIANFVRRIRVEIPEFGIMNRRLALLPVPGG